MAKSHQTNGQWSKKRGSPLRRLLQTRQIYVRSNGDVQFITVSPISQVCLLVIGLIALFWMAYASINIIFKDQLLELKQQKLFEARLDYENRLSELRASVEKVNDRLLLDQKGYLQKVDEIKAEFDDLAGQQKKIEGFFQQGWFPSKPSPAPAPGKDNHVEGAGEETFLRRYAADFRSRSEVVKPLGEMENLFTQEHARHMALLKGASIFARHKLETTTLLLTHLGIHTPGTANTAVIETAAMGGPYVAAQEPASREADIEQGMAEVTSTLDDESKVRGAVANLPLGKPMAEITGISSPFGYRKDPLRLTLAFHGGVDFKAVYGEPVLATSNGKVTWAGSHGPYGNLVEILHDNGVSTRYGHLKSVNVSLGQEVVRGDVVGWLGNTGRSTGPHLHYETRVNDQAIDPQNFWQTQNDLQALETLN